MEFFVSFISVRVHFREPLFAFSAQVSLFMAKALPIIVRSK
jgi:hypothetical protein